MSKSEFLVPIFGGTGNQMFQAAYAVTIGKKFGIQPVFVQMTDRGTTARNWELGAFDIFPAKIGPARFKRMRLRSSIAREIQKLTKKPALGVIFDKGVRCIPQPKSQPRIVSGYWQSKSYFENNEDGVAQLFKFPDMGNDKTVMQIQQKPRSVAIHIRRGDYVSDPAARHQHLICNEAWYEDCWKYMRSKITNCHAFVFSDDPAWVKENLNFDGDVTVVDSTPDEEPWKDMARMSFCENFIISNSSYSWWAAYLSASQDKIVVAPENWFNGVPTASIGICPEEWVLR
ncbi:MAG: alpha-1,2-fucosyltransferase [Rhodobacteraceae bacterium]|nr:alpha-1,2-fucosyltransferase [Paracoccaceae bacterium]